MNVCKCIRTCLRNLCNISVFSVNAPPHSKIRHSQSFFYRIKSCDKTDKQGKQREKASLKIQKIEKKYSKNAHENRFIGGKSSWSFACHNAEWREKVSSYKSLEALKIFIERTAKVLFVCIFRVLVFI